MCMEHFGEKMLNHFVVGIISAAMTVFFILCVAYNL